jgi:hypothetical protein
MSTRKQQSPPPAAGGKQRPMHTRKSAWKLGWPTVRPRLPEPARPEPVAG